MCYTKSTHITYYNAESKKITGDKMKKLIFTALVGLAMVAFTGCTTGNDAEAGAKCAASGKCASAKNCKATGKCKASGKCATGDKCKAKKAASKCASSGKCGSK
jgi:hypothetical protein